MIAAVEISKCGSGQCSSDNCASRKRPLPQDSAEEGEEILSLEEVPSAKVPKLPLMQVEPAFLEVANHLAFLELHDGHLVSLMGMVKTFIGQCQAQLGPLSLKFTRDLKGLYEALKVDLELSELPMVNCDIPLEDPAKYAEYLLANRIYTSFEAVEYPKKTTKELFAEGMALALVAREKEEKKDEEMAQEGTKDVGSKWKDLVSAFEETLSKKVTYFQGPYVWFPIMIHLCQELRKVLKGIHYGLMGLHEPSNFSPRGDSTGDSTENSTGIYSAGTKTPVALKALTVYRKAWDHWCGRIPHLDFKDEKQEVDDPCPGCGGNCGNEKTEKKEKDNGILVDNNEPSTPANTPKLEECDEDL
jgi:hypothetical protein